MYGFSVDLRKVDVRGKRVLLGDRIVDVAVVGDGWVDVISVSYDGSEYRVGRSKRKMFVQKRSGDSEESFEFYTDFYHRDRFFEWKWRILHGSVSDVARVVRDVVDFVRAKLTYRQ